MKKNDREDLDDVAVSCIGTSAKNLWLIGISVVALATLFCFIIFSGKDKQVPVQDPAAPVTALGAGAQPVAFSGCFPQGGTGFQQAAFVPPSCIPCPSVTQCFPGTNSAQPVAFTSQNHAGCPSFTQCFPQGSSGSQQVAFANPNCMTCPSFTQCFPPATANNQQVGMGQGNGFLSCPFCNFAYNDASAVMRQASRCPRCFRVFQFPGFNNGGFTKVALTNILTAPPIFRDAVMPHQYRGVCENCHQINPDIAIPANAQMPHEYRGVCSNCHTIIGLKTSANAGANTAVR